MTVFQSRRYAKAESLTFLIKLPKSFRWCKPEWSPSSSKWFHTGDTYAIRLHVPLKRGSISNFAPVKESPIQIDRVTTYTQFG